MLSFVPTTYQVPYHIIHRYYYTLCRYHRYKNIIPPVLMGYSTQQEASSCLHELMIRLCFALHPSPHRRRGTHNTQSRAPIKFRARLMPSLVETAILLFFTLLLRPYNSLSLGSSNNKRQCPQRDIMVTTRPMIRRFGIVEKLRKSVGSNNEEFDIYRLFMDDDGTFPNNKDRPVLLYKRAFSGGQSEATKMIVESGKWTVPWVWGIFTFHHYHSTAWELLLCTQGEADIQVGGPTGPIVEIGRGDLMLIPPGLAHKQLRDKGGFTLLGSYPHDSEAHLGPVDTLRGSPTAKQRENILSCLLPPKDPFFARSADEVASRNTDDHLD